MSRKAFSIIPPEGVPIKFELARISSRLGAQLLDILLTYGTVIMLFLLITQFVLVDWQFLFTLFIFLTFLIRTPYYVFSELIWNGRTPGKRLVKIRVISADGKRLTPYQIVVRNLMKEVEVFMPLSVLLGGNWLGSLSQTFTTLWMIGVLCVPFISKRNQRLGDMIAGTLVVDQPATILMPDLAMQPASDRAEFHFSPDQLGVYGRFELQTLEQILRTPARKPEDFKRIDVITQTIKRKINYTEQLAPAEHLDFLKAFYRQQREYLESRLLFGEARENKFHADSNGAPDIGKPPSEPKGRQ